MQSSAFKRNLSQVYLTLVPFLTFGIAMGSGHVVDYKIYLSAWLLNAVLMLTAAWVLGAHAIRSKDADKKQLVFIAAFLVVPWLFISIFAGFGPPPFDNPAEYLATATEQQARYGILIVAGLLIAFGFALLRESLKKAGENFYSWLGFIAIMIAAPLFVVYASSDSLVIEALKIRVASGTDKMPEWYDAVASHIVLIGVVEVALIYLSVAALAISLKRAGWFKKTPSNIYVIISLLGFLFISVSPFAPKPIAMAGFVFGIPAIPFIMPYLIGINLLRRAGN